MLLRLDWRSCSTLFSILSFMITTIQCDGDLRNQTLAVRWRNTEYQGTGLERTITIVTDRPDEDDVYLSGPDNFKRPAHSWVVFGATDEEGPLRVELVSPTIDGASYGFAISVIELVSEREDIGLAFYPLPSFTSRTQLPLIRTTRLRNAEIFSPSADLSIDNMRRRGLPCPVLRLALRLCANCDNSPFSDQQDQRVNSHSFAEALFEEPEFSPHLLTEFRHARRFQAFRNIQSRLDGLRWAHFERRLRLIPARTLWSVLGGAYPKPEALRQLRAIHDVTPTDYIFYQAPRPQPRLRGAPRQPPLAYVVAIDRSDPSREARTQVRQIKTAWKGLLWDLPPSPRWHRDSIVSLSRDARLTSGDFIWTAMDSLPPLQLGSTPSDPPPLPEPSTPSGLRCFSCAVWPGATLPRRSPQSEAAPWRCAKR